MIANIFGGDGLIVIVIALVVLVGGSQLPKIARNVGLAGKEFRNAQAEAEQEQAARKAKEAETADKPAVALPQAGAPVAGAPVAGAPTAVAAPAASAAPAAGSGDEAAITLTPAQLDALLKAREEQVRGESAGSN
jgi:Sec-independent protein translocase protein TatA